MDKKVSGIVKSFGIYDGKKAKVDDTPGDPNVNLSKHEGQPVDIDEYRSLVGKIMLFATKICLKIDSTVRAPSGYMLFPGPDHWKTVARLIGYIKGMDLRSIIYFEPMSFKTDSLADTDNGNFTETRRSVGCSIITVGRFVVDWWIAKHHTVSDSSCKAEYKELAKFAKGVKFVHMLLEELNLVDRSRTIG